MNVVAVIQARMGSSRFPGKTLKLLAGKPIIWHVVHRLQRCQYIDHVVLATTCEVQDDSLEQYAIEQGWDLVRGSEDNVLQRFADAARHTKADVILRVTGDAPLIDPVMIDRIIKRLLDSQAEYCYADPTVPCIHEGFSPFTASALYRLEAQASDDPVAKEHVTAYFKEHPEFATCCFVEVPEEEQLTGIRLSVDTKADLEFLSKLYDLAGAAASEIDIRQVVSILKNNLHLADINAHVHQKRADEKTHFVLLRCNANSKLGFGHFSRCVALASALRDRLGLGIIFAVNEEAAVAKRLEVEGFRYFIVTQNSDEESQFSELLVNNKVDAIVFDGQNGLSNEYIQALSAVTVVIDDSSDRRLVTDLGFYPPVPQFEKLNWQNAKGCYFHGWDWVVLNLPSQISRQQSDDGTPQVLLTMGGSDPKGFTLKALKAMGQVEQSFKLHLVVGPAFKQTQQVTELIKELKLNVQIYQSLPNLFRLMSKADIAVASFGVTAYELASMGVPVILLSLTDDHSQTAQLFNEFGMGISLGLGENISELELAKQVNNLLANVSERNTMSQQGQKLIDGKGAERIGMKILEAINECN